MATNAKAAPPPSNGVITGPPKGVVGGNRKKQKRRAKQAAKVASGSHGAAAAGGQADGLEYDEDPLGYGEEDDYDYSEAEHYHDQYVPPHTGTNGYSMPPPPSATGKKKGKKKRGSEAQHYASHNPELLGNHVPQLPNPPPPPPNIPSRMLAKTGRDAIWNTSSQQERQNIKDFWLSLSEDERKSLLKIEKEAVLRKMKQQQKHSCSCTVCGRKRTAIEEELEVLYEGYYEELEQYAHHDHPPLPSTDGMMPDPLQHRRPPHPLAAPPPPAPPHHRTSQLQEHFDEDEFSDEEEEEEYSDEEDYSDEEIEQIPRTSGVQDFFNFGQSLTVKDNLLTVADDLLKNDGRKFIEMMEQLAERRMARESEAEYAAANPSHPGAYPPGDAPYNHEDPLAAGEEYDDDEASYDSQEDYDDDLEDEDEMGGLTEEQRMQEGRRMFQIFAARMFEQRVLTAYKEKVAAERQRQLLEELDAETKQEAEKEAKKQRDAQKKKDKKKQQQAAKAEEKAKKDAEKAAEEARLKEAEEKKAEEQRKRKEEQRRKKEEEKKKQDEERARKEAEKARRLQEEQQRREEAERKAREQKVAEKARKEEARKREREEREAREKEARDRKAQEDKEKKEREAKTRAETEAKEREKTAQQAAQPPTQQQPTQVTKRPSQPGMVAVPGVYPKQTASGISSPHPTVATPAIPKAATPAKQRQPSQQGSHASSPKQSQSQVSSAPSKSSSPNSAGVAQQQQQQQQPPPPPPTTGPPKTIMQKPSNNQHPGPQQPPLPANSPLHQQHMHPPPGMPYPQHPGGFGGMGPMGFQSFQGPHGPTMPGNTGQRGPMPMFAHQGPPMGGPGRFGPPGGMPGMQPPGMMSPYGRGMAPPFDSPGGAHPPPGFGQPHAPQQHHTTPPIGQSPAPGAPPGEQRPGMPTHSRQHSTDKERFEAAANQPAARPGPIGRPGSVKPEGKNTDVDELSKHLGSSALLDDSDEPLPSSENRRSSGMHPGRPNHPGSVGPIGGFGAPGSSFGAPGGSWPTPSLPFGQGSSLGQQNWGGLPTPGIGSWQQNNAAFAANSFGPIGGGQIHRPAGGNRPQTIRISICHACKQLSARGESADGFHPVEVLVRQIQASNPLLADVPPTLEEIEDICETEGDLNNGGGELDVRKQGEKSFAVKWSPGAGTPDQGRGFGGGLGEIGSPMPQKSSPSGGYVGAPGAGRGAGGFQSLGAVGSSSGF